MIYRYKICIMYNKVTERCLYTFCKNDTHAKNYGYVVIRNMYGTKNTGYYIKVEKLKN